MQTIDLHVCRQNNKKETIKTLYSVKTYVVGAEYSCSCKYVFCMRIDAGQLSH